MGSGAAAPLGRFRLILGPDESSRGLAPRLPAGRYFTALQRCPVAARKPSCHIRLHFKTNIYNLEKIIQAWAHFKHIIEAKCRSKVSALRAIQRMRLLSCKEHNSQKKMFLEAGTRVRTAVLQIGNQQLSGIYIDLCSSKGLASCAHRLYFTCSPRGFGISKAIPNLEDLWVPLELRSSYEWT